jgi:hypothetical protein
LFRERAFDGEQNAGHFARAGGEAEGF